MHLSVQVSVTICIFTLYTGVFGWKHGWDRPVNFRCPSPTQTISHVVSIHNNGKEDRLHDFHCRRVPQKIAGGVTCGWSGYVNHFDLPVAYICPGAGYIAGWHSIHHNYYEDRRHKFYCCRPRRKNYHVENCYTTAYQNKMDQPLNYFVPGNYVLNGVFSYHNDRTEDRRTRFRVCKLKQC